MVSRKQVHPCGYAGGGTVEVVADACSLRKSRIGRTRGDGSVKVVSDATRDSQKVTSGNRPERVN